MSNIRLYVRSVYRSLTILGTIFISIKNLFKEVMQITDKKTQMHQAVDKNKKRLDKKRQIIKSEFNTQQNNIINLLR